MLLSPHFTLEELTASEIAARRGLDNTPDGEVVAHLRLVAIMLERVRDLLSGGELNGVPVLVSSGYRSPAVNAAVGGSATSAHCHGLAADFRAPAYGSPYDVARAIAAAPLMADLDQVIYEHTWVHIGLPRPGTMPRQVAMTLASRPGEPARYVGGIVLQGSVA